MKILDLDKANTLDIIGNQDLNLKSKGYTCQRNLKRKIVQWEHKDSGEEFVFKCKVIRKHRSKSRCNPTHEWKSTRGLNIVY